MGKNITNVTIYLKEERKEVEMTSEDFYVGRSDKSDIVIKNELLSRRHFQVRVNESKIKIKDLETTNGTYINQSKCIAFSWYEVQSDSVISVGSGDDFFILISKEKKNKEKSREETKLLHLSDYEDKTKTINKKPLPPESDQARVKRSVEGASRGFSENEALHLDAEGELFSQETHDGVRAILSKIEKDEGTQFSEIELLEIKKIEIESQVIALKIKEESELEARRLLDKSFFESDRILKDSRVEAEGIIESAEVEARELINKAEAQTQKEQEELSRKLSTIYDDIGRVEKEKKSLIFKNDELHEKIGLSLERKQELEFKNDSLSTELSSIERVLETLSSEKKRG